MTTSTVDGAATISVGQLRQNPTEMIRRVRSGAEYVLTDHGTPVARILPYSGPEWREIAEVVDLLDTTVDEQWADDLAADRAASDARDPFAR